MPLKKNIHLSRFGVYAVLKFRGEFILVKKGKGPYKGRWDLPGGKIDFGETPLEALEREIREETGLKAKNARLADAVGYKKIYKKEILHHVGIIYRVRAQSIKKLKTRPDGKDSLGARLFTAKELKKLELTPLAKEVLR